MKVTILNHCAHNKGDNSVLYYLDSIIRNNASDVEICLSSSDGNMPFWYERCGEAVYWPGGKQFKKPEDSYWQNKVLRARSWAIRRMLFRPLLYLYSKKFDIAAKVLASFVVSKKFIKAIVDADYVFCSGGHHISNVLEKDCVNAQLVSLAISDLYGGNTILWAQTIGPIVSAPKYVVRSVSRILDGASHIFVRDRESLSLVRELSSACVELAADSVFYSAQSMSPTVENVDRVVCAVYTAGITDKKYLASYKEAWVEIATKILFLGVKVTFVPMQYKGFSGDERNFLRDIVLSCNDSRVTYLDSDLSPSETIALYKSSRCVIGHKTHAVIYGLALSKPTVALAYHEKTRDFMRQHGLSSQVFDDAVGNVEGIVALVQQLLNQPDKIDAVSVSSGRDLEDKIKRVFYAVEF